MINRNKILKGVTSTGYAFSLSVDRLNDMELMDAFARLEDSDSPIQMSRVVTMFLGQEEKKKLYDHVRTKDGRVPMDALAEELSEMMNYDFSGDGSEDGGNVKNSSPSPSTSEETKAP